MVGHTGGALAHIDTLLAMPSRLFVGTFDSIRYESYTVGSSCAFAPVC